MNNEERKLWILLTVLAAAIAFGFGGLFVYAQRNPERQALLAVKTKGAGRPIARSTATGSTAIKPKPEAAFSVAMDQFRDAVREHPELSGEEIVAKVNTGVSAGSARPCPLEWHNGEAELQMQRNKAGTPSVTETINACTNAVEHLAK